MHHLTGGGGGGERVRKKKTTTTTTTTTTTKLFTHYVGKKQNKIKQHQQLKYKTKQTKTKQNKQQQKTNKITNKTKQKQKQNIRKQNTKHKNKNQEKKWTYLFPPFMRCLVKKNHSLKGNNEKMPRPQISPPLEVKWCILDLRVKTTLDGTWPLVKYMQWHKGSFTNTC